MEEIAQDLLRALEMMREALDLIDKAAVVSEVGAHLDLAICRLSEFVGETAYDSSS